MKKIIFLLFISLYSLISNGQTKKDGTPDKRYNSNKSSSNSTSYSNPTRSGSRPIYSGQSHTTSHGGTYLGEQNSKTHKGGTYKNPKSNDKYGIHKTK